MKFHMLDIVAHLYVGNAHDSQAHFDISPIEHVMLHGIEYLLCSLFSVAQ